MRRFYARLLAARRMDHLSGNELLADDIRCVALDVLE
jgi:hypothetical protein